MNGEAAMHEAEIDNLSDVASEVVDPFGGDHRRPVHTLLPEPVPPPIAIPIVSADDHLVEPGDLFVSRSARDLIDAAPRIIEIDGVEYWQFEDEIEPNRTVQTSAVGRPKDEWTREPVRFDEMRPGSYDPKARLADMDLAGVVASLCFPSAMFGFAGQRFYRMKDARLGLACMKAYNDWVIEEWVASAPDRFIAQQVTWLPDPEIAAQEVRRNAARGFRAVAFSENPQALGFPSLHTRHWDPFFAACEETGTVVDLHIGSSSRVAQPSSDSPGDVSAVLFPVNAMLAGVDWVYSRIPVRFPELRLALSEGGLSWVPMVLERLKRNDKMLEASVTWRGVDETPEEVFRRTFWFTSIEDYCGFRERHQIGVERIMLEVDYPHQDTSWPRTQEIIRSELGDLPRGEQQMIAYENACELYRFSSGDLAEEIGRGVSVPPGGSPSTNGGPG
jgi:predicted TIM-barrel fold metal-dependent hydrolase